MKDCKECDFENVCTDDSVCCMENVEREEKSSICPILTVAANGDRMMFCEKEGCAFWCGWTENCALRTIAGHLAELRR